MKRLLFIAAGILFTLQASAQKTEFGLTAGYLNIDASSSATSSAFGDQEESSNASGFYLGVLADISLSEEFYLQPSVVYGNAEDSNIISIPVLAKYYLLDSGFNLLAGPQLTIIIDDLPGTVKAAGVDLGFGGGYDFSNNIFLQAKYFHELTNRFDDTVMGLPEGAKFDYGVNTFFVGLGYKF